MSLDRVYDAMRIKYLGSSVQIYKFMLDQEQAQRVRHGGSAVRALDCQERTRVGLQVILFQHLAISFTHFDSVGSLSCIDECLAIDSAGIPVMEL